MAFSTFFLMVVLLILHQAVNRILYADLHVQITSSKYCASTSIELQDARQLQAFN